jgi:hypothetical protein
MTRRSRRKKRGEYRQCFVRLSAEVEVTYLDILVTTILAHLARTSIDGQTASQAMPAPFGALRTLPREQRTASSMAPKKETKQEQRGLERATHIPDVLFQTLRDDMSHLDGVLIGHDSEISDDVLGIESESSQLLIQIVPKRVWVFGQSPIKERRRLLWRCRVLVLVRRVLVVVILSRRWRLWRWM